MAKKKPAGDAEKAGGEGDAGQKKILGLPPMILIGAVAGVLVVGGGAGWWFLGRGEPKKEPEKPVVEQRPAPRPAVFIDLPDMTVNLASGTERQRFMRVKIALELTDSKLADQVRPLMPRVVDSFQVYLREMRPIDLQGSAGMYRMREELTRRVNIAVAPARVEAVLFREILVQ